MGTTFFPSRHRCCPRCTHRTLQTNCGEVVEYYHRGVAAHLVGFDLALPLDVELQGPGEGEVPAATRMLERLVELYPRYFDVVLVDGLYFEAPFVNACLAHGKHVLAILKGEHRVLLQEARVLRDHVKPQVWHRADRTVKIWDIEGFTCCDGIDVPLRVVWAEETVRVRHRIAGKWVESQHHHTWVWVTTAPRPVLPTRVLWRAGHARWDIEDDAFNVLATHWYLDHCFKHDPVAIENFILTLLVAFVLLQHFYLRNCKPPLRRRLSLIAVARQLYGDLASGTVHPPWPMPPAGTPP
jgi:hypothetical protein